MLCREAHQGAGCLGQAPIEIRFPVLKSTSEGDAELRVAVDCQRVHESLFGGEMASGRGMTDVQLAADLAQGQGAWSAGLERLPRSQQYGLA